MSNKPEVFASVPDLPGRIAEFGRYYNLDYTKGILISLSGGADSTALLFACAAFDIPLAALHVDHRLRSEAELSAEWELIEENCKLAGVPVERIRLSSGAVEQLAREEGCGIEAAARTLRYGALKDEIKQRRMGYIALGHTADDLVETMCVRFFQGSGISGLHGIPPIRLPHIRPLIETERREILSFLAQLGVNHSRDSSNWEDEFQRNRVRRRVLPMVEEEFPAYRQSLLRSAAFFREEEFLLSELSRERLQWRLEKEYAEIDARRFFGAPAPLRVRSLLSLCARFRIPAGRIPRTFLAISAEDANSAFIHRGHGMTLERRGRTLRFSPSVVFHGKTRYLRKVRPGEQGRIGPISFALFRRSRPEQDGFELELPGGCGGVIIRSRRSSDRIRTSRGTKSLKSIFNDQKVPEQLRDTIPVIVYDGEVVAVGASLFGFRDIRTPREDSPSTGGPLLQLGLVE